MLNVITGGSGSGKSLYAETLATSKPNNNLFYIGTMRKNDAESIEKINVHRLMRKNKGFTTIECFNRLENVWIPKGSTVLLDCISNLLANEMFDSHNRSKDKDVYDKIVSGVENILDKADAFFVVTNEVSSDILNYGFETLEYIRILGQVNSYLSTRAKSVTEVVYSIPVTIK